MPFARFQAHAVDSSGNIISNASIEVRSEQSGALAVLYTDRNGTIALANPFFADSEGYFYFHVQGGSYRVNASSGGQERDWRYVAVGTAAETDDQSGPIPGAFQNLIIGGDFTTNPWQRGTSFTAPATGSYSADRFRFGIVGSGVVNILKTADAPTIAQAGVFTQHCLHIDVTTADAAIAAGDLYQVGQRIEGLAAVGLGFGQLGARPITISFWVKATKTGIYCVAVKNGAVNRSYIAEYTVNSVDTWEKKIITVPGDTIGTWLYTNGIGINVTWSLASGSTFNTSANTWAAGNFSGTANQVNGLDSDANNFKLALIKVEAGSVDHDWFDLPPATVIMQCQRYYRKSFDLAIAPAQAVGVFGGASYAVSHVAAALFGVEVDFERMRAAPTVTTYNPQVANANWRDTTNGVDRTATVVNIGETGFVIQGAAGAAGAENYIHWQAVAEI